MLGLLLVDEETANAVRGEQSADGVIALCLVLCGTFVFKNRVDGRSGFTCLLIVAVTVLDDEQLLFRICETDFTPFVVRFSRSDRQIGFVSCLVATDGVQALEDGIERGWPLPTIDLWMVADGVELVCLISGVLSSLLAVTSDDAACFSINLLLDL